MLRWVAISWTNSQVEILIQNDAQILGALDFTGAIDWQDPNTTYANSIRVYVAWDEPPIITYNSTALNYPYYTVAVNATTNSSADSLDLYSHSGISTENNTLTINLTDQASWAIGNTRVRMCACVCVCACVCILIRAGTRRLYIRVVCMGEFNSNTGEAIPALNASLYLWVRIDDRYANYIDQTLLAFYGSILLLHLLLYLFLRRCFHCCYRRILPELYQTQNVDDDPYARTNFDKRMLHEFHRKIPTFTPPMIWQMLSVSLEPVLLQMKLKKIPNLGVVLQKLRADLRALTVDPEAPKVQLVQVPEIGPISPLTLIDMLLAIPDVHAVEIPKPPKGFTISALFPHVLPVIESLPNVPVPPLASFIDLTMHLCEAFPSPDFIRINALAMKFFQEVPVVQVPDDVPVVQVMRVAIEQLQLVHIAPEIKLALKAFTARINKFKMPVPDMKVPEMIDISPDFIENIPVVQVPMVVMDVDFKVPNPCCSPYFKFFLRALFGIVFGFISQLLQLLFSAIMLMWSVTVILNSFSVWTYFPVIDITELHALFEAQLGIWSVKIMEFFEYVISYVDIVDGALNWNCSGTLTLIAPLVFFAGATFVWLILQKDILFYFGVRLKTAFPIGRNSLVSKKMFLLISDFTVKLTILVLQAVVFALAKAATISTSRRSCSDVDFISNTAGKVVVAFFYVFFYMIFFFVFTGAPNWEAVERKPFLARGFIVFFTGIRRFLSMSSGVWNDDTLLGYNVIYRAKRYREGDQAFSVKGVLAKFSNRFAAPTEPGVIDSYHESVMMLIAHSRAVVWYPLPLGVNVAKLSETLTDANVFIFNRSVPLRLSRPPWLRRFLWVFNFMRVPTTLYFIFTGKEIALSVLFGSLLPHMLVNLYKEIAETFTAISNSAQKITARKAGLV